MNPDRRRRLGLRLHGLLSLVLLGLVLGLLAWLSHRYPLQADWTATARNTLSEPSRKLLEAIEGPVQVTAFATDDEILRRAIAELVERYRRHKPDLDLIFVDPDRAPDEVRRRGIRVPGEMVVSYEGREARASQVGEQALSSALERVARAGERYVTWLGGHGERDLAGAANHDLGRFGGELAERGFRLQPLDPGSGVGIPDNVALLVLSQPQVDLLPGEVALVETWVDGGGNLLWLADPGAPGSLAPVAEGLGLRFPPGTVEDPAGEDFGVPDSTFLVARGYGDHPVTGGFDLLTLYPLAAAVEAMAPTGWTATPLVPTGERARRRSPEDDEEHTVPVIEAPAGSMHIAWALQRPVEISGPVPAEREQRVIVIGDGDFLSNAYLGNGGNLELGLRMVRWLAEDDRLITVPARTAPDMDFALSRRAGTILALGWLLGMPIVLLATGGVVWLRRRGR